MQGMQTHNKASLMLLCAALSGTFLWLLPQIASAGSNDRDHDHDRARSALQSGEVMPLKTLLQQLERNHPGQVLEVELEQEHGRWVYEFKLLQTDGRLVQLDLDARSGAVLQQRVRAHDRNPR